jgi:hypothetical protein
VTRQVGDRGLIDATARVDIDSVDHLVGGLRVSLSLVLILVLSGWSQQQAAVRRKSESSKEGCQGLVGVKVGILHSHTTAHS